MHVNDPFRNLWTIVQGPLTGKVGHLVWICESTDALCISVDGVKHEMKHSYVKRCEDYVI